MKIFISYSQNDENLVKKVSAILVQQGHEIVHVNTILQINNTMQHVDNLKKVLKESDALILLYTENSINSSWLSFEFDTFIQYSKQSNSRKAIIPIVIDDIPIPNNISNYYFIKAKKQDIEVVGLQIVRELNRFQGELIAKEEEEKKIKDRIEKSSSSYVDETFTRLESREKTLREKANLWYGIGYGSIVCGIISAILFTILSSIYNPGDWLGIALLGLKSAIIILLLIASSKYSFNLAKTYMNESLKNSDRIHAISFGKFYLQIFGDKVDSKDIKEVFGDWNLDKRSNFLNMNTDDYDPKFVELLVKIIEAVKEKK